jgi:hypothetical protein
VPRPDITLHATAESRRKGALAAAERKRELGKTVRKRLAEIAQDEAERIAHVYLKAMEAQDGEGNPDQRARVRAADALLAQAFGRRPPLSIEVEKQSEEIIIISPGRPCFFVPRRRTGLLEAARARMPAIRRSAAAMSAVRRLAPVWGKLAVGFWVSGCQAGAASSAGWWLMLVCPLPSAFMTKISERRSGSVLTRAIWRPSGDHWGSSSWMAPLSVSRRSPVPSVLRT